MGMKIINLVHPLFPPTPSHKQKQEKKETFAKRKPEKVQQLRAENQRLKQQLGRFVTQ